jgi:hypothetical protein
MNLRQVASYISFIGAVDSSLPVTLKKFDVKMKRYCRCYCKFKKNYSFLPVTEYTGILLVQSCSLSLVLFYLLREEYFKSNAEVANSWSIKIRNPSVEEKEVDDTELMETEETMEDAELTAIRKELEKVPKSSQSSAKKMLK